MLNPYIVFVRRRDLNAYRSPTLGFQFPRPESENGYSPPEHLPLGCATLPKVRSRSAVSSDLRLPFFMAIALK
ncbi:MAG: hypothetical protein SWY16_14510 [Cyanobacteriota bacterium]|nr:hypothetical protein [Cyanobacteriota bacterium]